MSAEPGEQPERGGRLECLECGRWYRDLATHVRRTHGLPPADYRQRHGLPATLALKATYLREAQARVGQRVMQENPAAFVVPADELRRRAEAGRATLRETTPRPGVRRRRMANMAIAREVARDQSGLRRAKFAALADPARGGAPLDSGQVAQRAGLTARTIIVYASRGAMPPADVTVGRWPGWYPGTIEAWLDRRDSQP